MRYQERGVNIKNRRIITTRHTADNIIKMQPMVLTVYKLYGREKNFFINY